MSQGFSLSPKVRFVYCVYVYDNTIGCVLSISRSPLFNGNESIKILAFDNDVIVVFGYLRCCDMGNSAVMHRKMKRHLDQRQELVISLTCLIANLECFVFQALHAADHTWTLVVAKVICNVPSSSRSQQIGHDALRSLSCYQGEGS